MEYQSDQGLPNGSLRTPAPEPPKAQLTTQCRSALFPLHGTPPRPPAYDKSVLEDLHRTHPTGKTSMSSLLMVEIFVPRNIKNRYALIKFYNALRWHYWWDTEDDNLFYITPDADIGPVVGYWLTINPETLEGFEVLTDYEKEPPFGNIHRLRLAASTEAVLILSDHKIVERIWALARPTLSSQAATVDPADHRQRYPTTTGFRFKDPFGHRIRVTTSPNYELRPP
jgi:hypothetical protein